MGLRERVENNVTIWFLGAIITGFIAGIGTYEGFIRIGRMKVISQNQEQHYKVLLIKDRFLSLYLRYSLAYLDIFIDDNDDDDEFANFQVARNKLDEYMLKYIDSADKLESQVKFGKGYQTQTTINFSDGSQWIVPPDLLTATED